MSASNLRQHLLAAVNRLEQAEQAEEAIAGTQASSSSLSARHIAGTQASSSSLSARQQSHTLPVTQQPQHAHGNVFQRSFLWNTSKRGGGVKKKKLPSWTHTTLVHMHVDSALFT